MLHTVHTVTSWKKRLDLNHILNLPNPHVGDLNGSELSAATVRFLLYLFDSFCVLLRTSLLQTRNQCRRRTQHRDPTQAGRPRLHLKGEASGAKKGKSSSLFALKCLRTKNQSQWEMVWVLKLLKTKDPLIVFALHGQTSQISSRSSDLLKIS